MDIARHQQSSALKRYWLAPVILGLVLGLYWLTTASGSAAYRTDADTLLFGTVQRGDFSIKVRGAGVLAPKEIRWIAASVEGRAERVLVKPGAQVRAGDLLVELSNPSLHQRLAETRWELEALSAEAVAARVALETAELNQEAQVLDARLNFESSQLKLEAETRLFQQGTGVISRLDFERTKLETEHFKQRWAIERKRLEKIHENLAAQKNAQQARYNKLQKTVQMAEQQVANLEVRASMDSVVQAVPLEPGQRVLIGSNIAKLARQDQLIAELQIPESQVRDVQIDQAVVIDTRNSTIHGRVSRIAPSVENGTVQVDVELDQPLPTDARPDLSVTGEIRVAEFVDTLYVRRPAFAQSGSTAQIFKRSRDLGFIDKVSVQFGRGSVNQIQILGGLGVGDQIVVSDYADLQAYSRIRIN